MVHILIPSYYSISYFINLFVPLAARNLLITYSDIVLTGALFKKNVKFINETF